MKKNFYCKKKNKMFEGTAEAIIHCDLDCKEKCKLNEKSNISR